jgi:hypothetical protein
MDIWILNHDFLILNLVLSHLRSFFVNCKRKANRPGFSGAGPAASWDLTLSHVLCRGLTPFLTVGWFRNSYSKLPADDLENPGEEGSRSGGATGDMGVYRDDVLNPPQGSVALAEDPAVASAVPHRNHQLRVGGGHVGPLQGDLHVDRYRAGHQQHVGKAGGGCEVDAEPFAVVECVVHGVDLQLAAVARSRIHLADGQAPVKGLPDPFLQPCADDRDLRLYTVR